MSRALGMYTMTLFAVMLAAACGHAKPPAPTPAVGPMAFETPHAAVAALVQACRTNDVDRVDAIFGETHRDLVLTGDQAADAERCQRFVRAAAAMTRLDPWGDHRLVVVVGTDDFPFPVPLVQHGTGWQFDPEAGAAEVLRRRAGENEIGVIGACRSWAQQQHGASGEGIDPARPFHGYYFQVLAPPSGPARGHVNGRGRSGGVGLVAWPAEYRVTGVQSFLVGPDGVVLEKDLGPNGARGITTYDPDASWRVVSAD